MYMWIAAGIVHLDLQCQKQKPSFLLLTLQIDPDAQLLKLKLEKDGLEWPSIGCENIRMEFLSIFFSLSLN